MIATTTYTNCYTYAGIADSTNTKEYMLYASTTGNPTYKLYTNSHQSIYANIRDGLTILRNKYNVSSATSSTTASGTVFETYEREWLRATWGYNGFVTSTTYLTKVAGKMDTFSDYISSTGTQMVATSTFTADLADKLRIADEYKEEVIVFSPVELAITDSMGRTTGIVNGVVKEEIPDSAYSPQRKAIAVFFSSDSYTYTVRGTGEGTYGLLIDPSQNNSQAKIYAPAIPIRVGEAHKYRVDWGAINRGEKGVSIQIDSDGNGVVDKEIFTDAMLSDITLFTASPPTGFEQVSPRVETTVSAPQTSTSPPTVIRLPAVS